MTFRTSFTLLADLSRQGLRLHESFGQILGPSPAAVAPLCLFVAGFTPTIEQSGNRAAWQLKWRWGQGEPNINQIGPDADIDTL